MPDTPMDSSNRTLSTFLSFVTVLLVVATLYLGQQLFMPLALACLFAFLLNPLVRFLCGWHLSRAISVSFVTIITFSALAMVAWLLGGEMARLASELPRYQSNIQGRVAAVQKLGENTVIRGLHKMITTMSAGKPDKDSSDTGGPASPAPPAAPPAPAPIQAGESLFMKALNMVVPTLANAIETASVVVLFVVFMLLRLDDISQRLVRLVGYSRLTVTTRAIDEASDRISRYLLMQGTVNAIYGLLLAGAMAAIGLPYVILWGVMAALFRFIPYIGPIIIATFIIGMSLAFFDGWTLPLVVIGVVLVLELGTNMILEPMLYGHSVGVSDFALLVAIAFWTWLWGGFGLVLATPLTVCIVVFCKYIPSLEWVDVVMGENPPPQPHLSYYQQHLANNEDAAQAIIDAALKEDGAEKALENIALPALALTRREHVLGKLADDEAAQIYDSMHSSFLLLKEEIEDNATVAAEKPGPSTDSKEPRRSIQVFARALQGEADAQALEMLSTVLPPGVNLEISAEPHLIGELVRELEEKKPALLCISALPPRSQAVAGILCRRLRCTLPDLKIMVCRWGLPNQQFNPKPLRESGATWVVSSIHQARDILERMVA